jgi:ATP-dependent exoDNAse (exonuclease V) beta subunit
MLKIYRSSAGSGKTFTLVKEYLRICIQARDVNKYRHILAITFTNKACNEMKERIIHTFTILHKALRMKA